jgi:hypothetical protein
MIVLATKLKTALLGNFDLMIEVSTSWSILLDKFDLMNKHNFDLMKNEKKFDLMYSTSWKSEFRSHEIRPPDPESFITIGIILLTNIPSQILSSSRENVF